MHKFALTLAFLFAGGALAFAGPEALSSGKEMKQVAPATPPGCDYSWTGFYIGLNAGYGWGDADTHFDPLPSAASFNLAPATLHNVDPSGVIGGGQIGFNWQMNHWLVVGGEADFQGSDVEGFERQSPVLNFTGTPANGNPNTFRFSRERTDWFGTVRGRIGFTPWCRLLIYGTGGLAYGNVHYAADTNLDPGVRSEVAPASFDRTSVGWTAGGGLEYALTHRWSVKVEYLYYDFGDQGATGPLFENGVALPPFAVHYNWQTTANIVRGGINFKF